MLHWFKVDHKNENTELNASGNDRIINGKIHTSILDFLGKSISDPKMTSVTNLKYSNLRATECYKR